MTNEDHDALVRLSTQIEYLIKEVQAMRDGTKKDISDLQIKVDLLEKAGISSRSDVRAVGMSSLERSTANSLRITALETATNQGVTRHETNVSYWVRLVIEKALLPFIFLIAGIVLTKLGIINLNPHL